MVTPVSVDNFVAAPAGEDGNGLYMVDLATGARRGLDNAEERYSRLTWSEVGDALAVLRGDSVHGKIERYNSLIAFTGFDRGPPARFDFDGEGNGLRDGWVLSEKGPLIWNEDATALFVSTRAQADELDEWPDEGLPLADVNIWHWADDRIQSAQQQQASTDRDRTYVAALHLDAGRLVHLADERMRTVEVARSGRWGIGRDNREYVSDWQPRVADYYRVDTRTGERTSVLEAHLRTLGSLTGQRELPVLEGRPRLELPARGGSPHQPDRIRSGRLHQPGVRPLRREAPVRGRGLERVTE